MPILSKRPQRKTRQPFKPPVLAKEKFEKILNIEFLENENVLNDSVSTTSTDFSSRLNEPAIKKMYMDFTVNLSKQIMCSTPVASQEIQEETDVANMSFKDHMMNVLKNTPEEPIAIASDDEHKENCATAISLSQEMLNRKEVKEAYMELLKNETEEKDLEFMKNFKKTKKVKRIFSSFEINEKNEQKQEADQKLMKLKREKKESFGKVEKIAEVKKFNINKVEKPKPLDEYTKDKQSKSDVDVEKPKKQRKPKIHKEKPPKDKHKVLIKETKNFNNSEADKDKPSKKTIMTKNKRKNGAVQMDSGICSDEITLTLQSSENNNLQAAQKHRKLHTRALGTISEESYISSAATSTEQALVCKNSLYDTGTVVWAKIDGFPWWPAMVDDDPDFGTHIWMEENFKEPTWYHVTFFDVQEVTRSWVRPNRIRAYGKHFENSKNSQKIYSIRLKGSIKQAENALEMSWSGRIEKYRFIIRYPKGVGDLEKEREKKEKLNEVKEKKSQKRKEKYLQQLKNKVAKAYKNESEEKKKRTLRLYSTDLEKELQEFVDTMGIEKQNLNDLSFDLLEGAQMQNVASDDSGTVI